ncbi:DUF2079 domain-containing protein [Planotetraspora sp. A-T 1434]|uniref:DUF2079 domain-containing protein n=1 Tax=Planotetraspora sp. A-T 1434 TaxID=2979219 RepID=UPI0021BFDBEF|nr:DUF2079 domain-containing protein [Planotetraspora sp. A-T 1434]MCT9931161.1 DUF2079 domain-containing protein [Planotetraspora sp. A-T 1434]
MAITVTAAGLYALLSLVRFYGYRASNYDLVIHDQAVRGYAAFTGPICPLLGFDRGLGLGFSQLGDHFAPILAILAPLYWLHDGPETLLVAQAVLFALAIPPIWSYTRRMLGTGPAYLVATAYAISWPVAQAVNFDFHEVAFVPVLTAVMIERFHAKKHVAAALAAAALLLVKEDMGLVVAGFGCFALIRGRRLNGAAYIALGLSYTLLVREVLTPAFGGDPMYHWHYDGLGKNIAEVLGTFASDPLSVLNRFVTPQVKVETLAFLLWPALLTCLFSPLMLMALPHFLERMLSDIPNWWASDFQYNAFTVVIILCAGVDGTARLAQWMGRRVGTRTWALTWAAGVFVAALTLVPRFPFYQLIEPQFYERGPDVIAADEAIKVVPDGVVVEAANNIGPRLSGRTTVLNWGDLPPVADWIVADVARISFPWHSTDEEKQRADELVAMGYEVVFYRDGYVVLHRTSPSGQPAKVVP